MKILHGFTDKVIALRKEELAKQTPDDEETDDCGTKKKLALLDLLLQVKIDDVALTNTDIREEVDTFMFGGEKTSDGFGP